MRCNEITVGNRSPQDERTVEWLFENRQTQGPLGKLLIALIQELTWSDGYTVYASLDEADLYLTISHKTFLPDRPLVIKGETETAISVRGVENAIRAHIRESQEVNRPAISTLQGQVNDLDRTFDRINIDKARVAIIATFPEAALGDLEPIRANLEDLYAFGERNGEFIFVAREVGHEFIGGVARLEQLSRMRWYAMQNGALMNQRHGVFWAELARAFAARELKIAKNNLH